MGKVFKGTTEGGIFARSRLELDGVFALSRFSIGDNNSAGAYEWLD